MSADLFCLYGAMTTAAPATHSEVLGRSSLRCSEESRGRLVLARSGCVTASAHGHFDHSLSDIRDSCRRWPAHRCTCLDMLTQAWGAVRHIACPELNRS